MALPILDGNQSAATLSTIITGGAHIPAHTVVSLGSQAISDITNGVSGSVVSISNFPASQTTTFGAVTGSVSVLNFPASQAVTFLQASVTFGATTGSVSVINFPSTQTIAGTVTANIPLLPLPQSGESANSYNIQAGGVDINGYVWPIPLTPEGLSVPIAGTVTANVVGWDGGNAEPLRIGGYSVGAGDTTRLALEVTGIDGNPIPISGTVTANVSTSSNIGIGFRDIGGNLINVDNIGNGVPSIIYDNVGNSAVMGDASGQASAAVAIGHNSGGQFNIVGENSPLPVSGTVTANNPNGSLTTRFGSVTTANTAQITSAVTNANRKYLLAQNISAGTVTIGIGFSPTTTQGIQLPAGGGLTFDAFCPTGAVYWLGAVTGAAFTILEG